MKIITLTENYEFKRAYNHGQSFVAPALVTYIVRRRSGGIRIGITAGKKVGNAVKRNRARRVIRAAFCELAPGLSGNWEIVFVARGKTPFVKTQEVLRCMRVHLKDLGVKRQEARGKKQEEKKTEKKPEG